MNVSDQKDVAMSAWLAIVLMAATLLACGSSEDFCENQDEVLAAEICYQPNPADCVLIPGCSARPACIESDCVATTQQECEQSRHGCVWIEEVGCRERYLGVQVGCLSIESPEACATSEYCYWDVACDGDPKRVDCSEFDEGECFKHGLECSWHTRDELTPGSLLGI